MRRRESGINEFKAESWEPGVAQHEAVSNESGAVQVNRLQGT